MQDVRDIFGLWPTIKDFAHAVGASADTARKWKKYGRIPIDFWQGVIEAAANLGKTITTDDLLSCSAPRKQREWPARKASAIKRKPTRSRRAQAPVSP